MGNRPGRAHDRTGRSKGAEPFVMLPGNFFAIDRRCWSFVSRIGLNEMVAYVVLARGTGPDQRTTAWSVNAIELRTGMARSRAAVAIGNLVKHGVVDVIQGGTRPRYRLRPAEAIDGCLPKLGAGKGVAKVPEPESRPDWVWLPNTLVDGAADEVPPLTLLRQSQDTAALRLFIELYHSHNLAEDGGIHWRKLRQGYDRETLGSAGEFTVYGFRRSTLMAWPDALFVASFRTGKTERDPHTGEMRDPGWPLFWSALGLIQQVGLLRFVPHLVEADNEAASILHPYDTAGGEGIEARLAYAANDAGRRLLNDAKRDQAGGSWVAPIRSHFRNVAMVGIPRLRYHPHTAATGEWAAQIELWEEWVHRYSQLAPAQTARNAA